MNLLKTVPAQYSKFLASLTGLLLIYLEQYGANWHLVPAVTALAASLGVLGVPNTPAPSVTTKEVTPHV